MKGRRRIIIMIAGGIEKSSRKKCKKWDSSITFALIIFHDFVILILQLFYSYFEIKVWDA
jgi:hypothetical protein